MNDTLSNKKTTTAIENQKRICEEQYSIIKALFIEASNITEETPRIRCQTGRQACEIATLAIGIRLSAR